MLPPAPPMPNSKRVEIQEVRAKIENVEYVSCDATTQDYVSFTVSISRYKTLKVGFQFPSEYPAEPLVIEMKSKMLGKGFLRKLRVVAELKAKALANKHQIIPCVLVILSTLKKNLLAPAMQELRALTKLANNLNFKLFINEDEGKVTVKTKCKKYILVAKFIVPELYPDENLKIEITKSNYSSVLTSIHKRQAEEVVRRCMLGFKPIEALDSSLCKRGPKSKIKKKNNLIHTLDKKSLLAIRKDVKQLKKTSDLQKVNNAKKQGDNRSFSNSTQARRFARRELKRFADEDVRQQTIIENEMRMQSIKAAKSAGNLQTAPTPSLAVAVQFIVERFALHLPCIKCEGCKEDLLPQMPEKLHHIMTSGSEKRKRRTSKCLAVSPDIDMSNSKRPELLYCNHWWHLGCLDTVLCSPVFFNVVIFFFSL